MKKDVTAVAVHDNGELVQRDSASLLEVIAKAVADPRIDVAKMERLLALHEKIMADQRKTAFVAALSRLQAKVPQIEKDGRIIVKGQERSRYARLETIDEVIRPLTTEEGFAFSFDTQSQDGKLFVISARLSHKDGHSETKSLVLPIDKSDYRSDVQSIGSTVSYGRRQLIKLHLNIIERSEDTDGTSLDPISAEQVKELNTMIVDSKADRARFLLYMNVKTLEEILLRDYQKAITALEAKKRQ